MRPLFSCLLAAAFLQTSPVAAQPAGQAPQRNEVLINRRHPMVKRALDQKTSHPLASMAAA